ncbi:pre-mRNA-splicing factor 18 [Phalaenopsis equestris]|uniref:pre-mRNA-splicing factor 18 n=1 Tax=Phalaenopsis equestris TaxID=78828 RepID=UPI0009E52D36|nr:pre-mRNA-splicing factor 18 [Phalaenopsis equestris]
MDLLMSELRKKRQSLQSDFGGKKLLRRSEIEEKKIQKIREEEQRDVQAKNLRQHPPSTSSLSAASAPSSSSDQNPSVKSSLPPALASLAAASSSKKHSDSLSEEQRIDDLVLSRQDVIRHLRVLKQPITVFGEDDDARLERLKMILKSGILDIDSDITEGQTNDFLRDIYEMRKRQKAGSFLRETKHKRDDSDGMDCNGVEDGDKSHSGNGASSGPDADKDLKSMKANFEELCDEDKILVFFKRLLNEWNQELDEMPEAEKRTAKGKSMVATFNQCARYLNPLFKFCRKKVLPDDIRQALMLMVRCCMDRDYLAAMDHYIRTAIGNAPWPIGVTMVGIHERSAREKIYTNSVAHIMNDETTRKYLQSVKRLMTFCQRKYPALPSKSVEFNSLANGSDLHSLLAEERTKSSVTEEKLRLMPAP